MYKRNSKDFRQSLGHSFSTKYHLKSGNDLVTELCPELVFCYLYQSLPNHPKSSESPVW